MAKTFEQGRTEIARLSEYFARNHQSFLAPGVKEAHVRQSLIDPFFEALGWDVHNAAQVAPQYREVMQEDALEIEGQQKAPDYTFRLGTLPKFYAEAKRCGVNIFDDPAPAYQLRRYGWSARLALSVLTDFEEFGVYDCTLRPRPADKAGHARILYMGFAEYPDRWRELWDIFSRDAVWSGGFDEFTASKRKRGTSPVDEEFLKEIEGWREELAHNIALRNRGLSGDDLNRAVQLTIDRIVFLRMAEDRGLEPYAQLLALGSRPGIYARFMSDLCRKADDKYNSGLFHFEQEAGASEPPDRVTPGLAVDDAVLKPILERLYFEHGSPYNFRVLPVEILGTVYERFLGKVIRLTPDHHAKVEEKPEVRKAGGVYYTPKYIVDYIVRQTVGRQIAGRSPAQLAGSVNVAHPPSGVQFHSQPGAAGPQSENVAHPPSGVNGRTGPQLPFAKPSRDQYRRDLPHIQMAERPIFLTFCTSDRWQLPERVRDLVIKHCLHDQGLKYQMHGVMVMPDHVHMILSLHRDPTGAIYSLAEVMNGIKGSSAHSINKALNRKGHVWQDESYDHVFRTQENLNEAVEYICWNPVRKGLVAKVEDWPWLWRESVAGVAHPASGVHCQSSQPGAAGPQSENVAPPPSGVNYQSAQPGAAVPQGRKQPFRILDMACGSGSFLLGAYQFLLDHCLAWYAEHSPERHKKAVYSVAHPPSGVHCQSSQPGAAGPQTEWRLTVDEKKRILTTHVFGVDIDPQAVEVSKLSLLLKVLEGETDQSLHMGLLSFRDRALPNLSANIKCGNSLIGPDYFSGALLPDPDEMRRVNPFDWSREFPEAMAAGGFDCVIGNPPYVRIQTMADWAPLEAAIYKEIYRSARAGNYDIYVVFVERGLKLLKSKGRLGFILPSKFFATDYGEALRGLIAEGKSLSQVVDFGAAQVFVNATTYTCLLFLSASPTDSVSYSKVVFPPSLATHPEDARPIAADRITQAPWSFSTDAEGGIATKLAQSSIPLGDLPSKIARGSSTGDDNVFMLVKQGKSIATRQGETVEVEPEAVRVPLYATDFNRYSFEPHSGEVVIFPYEVSRDGYSLISESAFRREFPKAYRYLASRKKTLDRRKQFQAWYGFSAPRSLDVHDSAQILVPLLANRGSFCRLPDNPARFSPMASGGFSITVANTCSLSPNYVLGLLNSRLLFWRLQSISNIFRAGWITCTKQYVETLPIRNIDFSKKSDKAAHDRVVSLVESMLELHKRLAAAKSEAQKAVIRRQIDHTDAEIDRLVYDLYGLTKEEIAIVEGAVS